MREGDDMTSYVTIAGDMWDCIAYKTMGDEMYMADLIKANKQYRNIYIFSAGITLVIPKISEKVSSSLPPWKRDAR